MVWLEGREMKRCRACGYMFAFRWAGEWYCSSVDCQAAKKSRRRRAVKPKVETPWGGLRAAESDAKAALAELHVWMAQERAKW